MVLGGRRQVSGAWALLDRLIVLAAGGRYGSTVVAWSHGSTVQCSFCRKPSSVHPYTLRRIASGAGGARVRRRNDLLVFHTPESLPMSSLVPCRATDRSAAGESIIANINKDIPYPRTPTRPPISRKTHSAGASGRPCVCQIRACIRVLHDSSRKSAVEWRSVGHTCVRYGSL